MEEQLKMSVTTFKKIRGKHSSRVVENVKTQIENANQS